MKNNLKLVIYIISSILLIISSYTIILNVKHVSDLTDSITVSEADIDYQKYKENVKTIEGKLQDYKNTDAYLPLVKVLDGMKRNGVYRLIPKEKIKSIDLYELNDYFMEELINNCWVSNIQIMGLGEKYQDVIMLLVNNTNYMNSILTNNSLILSDDKTNSKEEDNYHFILKNYVMYSNIILSITDDIGGNNG
jgi:hypothetical protein